MKACARSRRTSPTRMGWSATTGQVAPWVYQQSTETFVLDPEMRERLAALNPTASAKIANRLIEAHERNYWTPDAQRWRRCVAPARTGRPPRRRRRGEKQHEHVHPTHSVARAPPRRRRGQRAGAAGPDISIGNGQGVRRLRQGRHRQEHDVVQSVGRLLQARQAGAADRLRSEARLDLHPDQVPGADGDRRAGDGELPLRGTAASRTSSIRATTA